MQRSLCIAETLGLLVLFWEDVSMSQVWEEESRKIFDCLENKQVAKRIIEIFEAFLYIFYVGAWD